jgi:hypothetical protein
MDAGVDRRTPGVPGFERLNKRLQDAVEAAIIGRKDVRLRSTTRRRSERQLAPLARSTQAANAP